MASRMKADTHPVDRNGCSIWQKRKLCVIIHPHSQQMFAWLGSQITATAPACVISMGMSDDSTIDWLNRIDIKITLRTVQTAIRRLNK
jgi:hypothetical protein